MKKHSLDTYIMLHDNPDRDEVEVTVTFTVSEGCPASYGNPEEPSEIDILSVVEIDTDNDFETTKEQDGQLKDRIWERIILGCYDEEPPERDEYEEERKNRIFEDQLGD